MNVRPDNWREGLAPTITRARNGPQTRDELVGKEREQREGIAAQERGMKGAITRVGEGAIPRGYRPGTYGAPLGGLLNLCYLNHLLPTSPHLPKGCQHLLP